MTFVRPTRAIASSQCSEVFEAPSSILLLEARESYSNWNIFLNPDHPSGGLVDFSKMIQDLKSIDVTKRETDYLVKKLEQYTFFHALKMNISSLQRLFFGVKNLVDSLSLKSPQVEFPKGIKKQLQFWMSHLPTDVLASLSEGKTQRGFTEYTYFGHTTHRLIGTSKSDLEAKLRETIQQDNFDIIKSVPYFAEHPISASQYRELMEYKALLLLMMDRLNLTEPPKNLTELGAMIQKISQEI